MLRRLIGFALIVLGGCYLVFDLILSQQTGLPDWTPTGNPILEIFLDSCAIGIGLYLLFKSSKPKGQNRR